MVEYQKRDRNDLYNLPVLGFLFKNQTFIKVLQLFVLALFIYAIVFGFIYPTKAENHFTTAVFWSLFWSLFIVVTLSTMGRVFCGICPHGFIGKYITKWGLKKKMPKSLANPYIGIALLVIGFWAVYYIYPQAYKTPLASSVFFSVLSIIAIIFFYLYKDMSYCKSICPIGTMMKVFGKISFTKLGSYHDTCKDCRTFECATACHYNLKPFTFDTKNSMTDCTLCMDCSSACEAINFKLIPPSQPLTKKFQINKAEVWAILFITAAITITMSFHHALGRLAIADQFIWAQTGMWLKEKVGIAGLDYVGISALFYAMITTIGLAVTGMYIAAKVLKEKYTKLFYTLGYAFVPLFIIGGLSHTYQFFFFEDYHEIANGFIQGFGINSDPVQALATRRDKWVYTFSILQYIAVIWALVIMFKRLKFFTASKIAKGLAFTSASALIFFYLGLNLYKGYAMKTYGMKKRGHGDASQMHQKSHKTTIEQIKQ